MDNMACHYLSFQAQKYVNLTKKVGELTDDLLKLKVENKSLVTEMEKAKNTEQHNTKTYEDELQVLWTLGVYKRHTVFKLLHHI